MGSARCPHEPAQAQATALGANRAGTSVLSEAGAKCDHPPHVGPSYNSRRTVASCPVCDFAPSNREAAELGAELSRLGMETRRSNRGAWDNTVETNPSSVETSRSNRGAWDNIVETNPSSVGTSRSTMGAWDKIHPIGPFPRSESRFPRLAGSNPWPGRVLRPPREAGGRLEPGFRRFAQSYP